jgi:hypothetical protein
VAFKENIMQDPNKSGRPNLIPDLSMGNIEAANAQLVEYSESCRSSVRVRLDSSDEGYIYVYVGDSTQPLRATLDVEEASQYAVELIDGEF